MRIVDLMVSGQAGLLVDFVEMRVPGVHADPVTGAELQS